MVTNAQSGAEPEQEPAWRRSPETGKDEAPLNEHNHALDALRYLVLSLDARYLARPYRRQAEGGLPDSSDASAPAACRPARDPWLRFDNDAIWTPLNYEGSTFKD